MDGIGPQAMINPEIPGGGLGGAAGAIGAGEAPTKGIWPSVKGWFQEQDPNFWSVLLGSIGQSAPPGSWQHQLGGTASQIARGQIMAKAMRGEREEGRRRWDELMGLMGGGRGKASVFAERRDPFSEIAPEVPGEPDKPGRKSIFEQMMGGLM